MPDITLEDPEVLAHNAESTEDEEPAAPCTLFWSV
jgi:hypothetical protein